jgi:hypothetical protein
MILYYALGGGLGHITRALAVSHTLRVREKVVIISSMNPSALEFIPDKIQLVQPPAYTHQDSNKLIAYIQHLIEEYRPSEFIIDSFPLGVYGELKNIVYTGIRTYLARLLKWDRYTKVSGNQFFIFNQTFILEPLHDDHRFIIDRISETLSPLELSDPLQIKPLPAIADLDRHWLVLHSGPDDEVDDLITHAKQIREIEQKQNPLLLVTPSAINKWTHQPVTHIRFYPALLLMPHVEKIITACGFNTMRQANAYRNKHHFFPFARRFDDQYFRAALYRSVGGKRKNNDRNNTLHAFSEDTFS